MRDTRNPLPVGTKLGFDSGSIYKITGAPIGFGGGSIIYPALRYTNNAGQEISDGFDYVLKECFPVSSAHNFLRSSTGGVIPESTDPDGEGYLQLCKDLQLREEETTKKLYKTTIHTLPIRESARHEKCTLPGQETHTVDTVFTAMTSLSLKGNTLASFVENRRMLPYRQCFAVAHELLCALREIHDAGFLHLDIQTGNVFIQGSLEQGGSILTLLDFGCARPITGGHTDAIVDRLVFTTQGFAAPEIILHNDGTLVLGPEADIYSAGCVLLTLLTGKRYDSAELISNKTGRFIDALKMYRIGCPRHLTEKLQRIIAKALKVEPSERYHTADEMLEDINSFINALPAQVTPLANTEFDAFISYRHGEIDSPVALELQKCLEHFRAPRGTSSDKRSFKRCYVDEGELSSGYDYAKQLREVLKNSKWLIVVCSPGTGDSRWVNEEIDIFLETHDRSRVLALLTYGEPEQSFPPRLLEETPKGDLLIAADARGKELKDILRNIRGDALLKLAAPMLETTFDSLKQREKIYKLRRFSAATAAVTALAVAFGIYAADRAATIAEQAERIEEEYRNSLINESLFLTGQAQKHLAEEDTVGAVELALKALPSQTQDRPVLADAEYILGKALNTYSMPGKEPLFEVTKVYDADSRYRLFTDDAGQLVFTLEEQGKRVCAREKNYDLINSVFFPGEIFGSSFSPSLLAADRDILFISSPSGLFRWNYRTNDLIRLSGDYEAGALVSHDGSFIAAVTYEKSDGYEDIYSIALTDTETGKIREKYRFDYDGPGYFIKLQIIDPNDGFLVFSVTDNISMLTENVDSQLYILDFSTGEIRQIGSVPNCIYAIRIMDKYLACCSSYDLELELTDITSSLSRPVNIWLFDMEKDETVCCFEEPRHGQGYKYCIEPVKYNDGKKSADVAVFTYASFCEAVELSTGKVLRKYDFDSPLVNVRYKDNSLLLFTRDGCMSLVNYSDEFTCDKFRYLCKDIDDLCIVNGGEFIYAYQKDKVLRYERGVPDSGFRELMTADGLSPNNIRFLYEPGDVRSTFWLLKDSTLYATDTRENKLSQIALPFDLSASPNNNYALLGSSADGENFYIRREPYLSYYGSGEHLPEECEYYIVSLKNGDVTAVSEAIWAEKDISVEDAFFHNGRMYYAASEKVNSGVIRLCSWVPGDKDIKILGSYTSDGSSYFPFSLNVSDSCIGFALRNKNAATLVAFDAGQNRFHGISDAFPENCIGSEAEFNRYAYSWDREHNKAVYSLRTMQPDGSEKLSLNLAGTNGFHASPEFTDQEIYLTAYTPEGRLIVFGSDTIREYSNTGETLRWIDLPGLNLYNRENDHILCQFNEDNTMSVSLYGASVILDLSHDRLGMGAYIPYGMGYDEVSRRIIVLYPYDSRDVPNLGSFHRYTVQELMEMGEIIVNR